MKSYEMLMGEITELKSQLASALSREKALRKALEDLRDVQNGPPLIRWEKEWNEAMEKTRQALEGQPEPKEVTREELAEEIRKISMKAVVDDIKTTRSDFMAFCLLSRFTITERRKG